MRINGIDIKNVEKLVQAESKRRKILWQRKSKKLLWATVACFIIILMIL